MLVVITAGCLIISELAARVIEGQVEALRQVFRTGLATEHYYERAPQGRRYRYQPSLRWTGLAGIEVISWHTNSLGMLWREVEVRKASGITRVAFVGDSFTAGGSARDYSTGFVGIVDAALDRRRFEVLNFGMGGYGLHEIHEQIIQEVVRFSPDLIVLSVFTGNDFRDTFFGFDTGVDRDGGLMRIPTKDARRAQVAAEEVPGPADYLDFDALNSFTSYTYWSRRDYSPLAAQAVDESLDYLNQIHEFCLTRGIGLFVAAVPYEQQVTTSHPVNDVYDVGLPQSHVESWAEGRGVPYLDLLPVFRNLNRTARQNSYVAAHWNTRGNRIGGRAIAEALLPLLGAEALPDAPGTMRNRVLDAFSLARFANLAYYRLTSLDWR